MARDAGNTRAAQSTAPLPVYLLDSKGLRPLSPFRSLRDEPDFPLVPERQDPDLVLRHDEAIQGDVAGLAVRDHQFPDVAREPAAEQGMESEDPHGRTHGLGGRKRGVRILARKQLEGSLQVREGARRMDYRRHGLGRAGD
jgi:hypothetical protein